MDLGERDELVSQDGGGHQLRTQTFGVAKDQQFVGMVNPPNISTPTVDSLNFASLLIRSCSENGPQSSTRTSFNMPIENPRTVHYRGPFLPSFNEVIPPNASNLPSESDFVAARFSCFSNNYLTSTTNPSSGRPGPTILCTKNSEGVPVSQVQKGEHNVVQLSKDLSLPTDCGSKSRSPRRNQEKNAIPHELIITEVGQKETAAAVDATGDSSTYDHCAKKRRSSNQNLEFKHMQGGSKLPVESTKEDSETKEDVEHGTPKSTGKNAKDISEPTKVDYVHVRARRGQATNSHSLAERVRREKISARMKYLQELVPGCSKVTGKAVMLDEIINYVQSLQRQVELLSMRLAAIDPSVNLNTEGHLLEHQHVCSSSTVSVSPDVIHPPFYPAQQCLVPPGIPGLVNPADAYRREISALLIATHAYKEPTVQIPNTWQDGIPSVMDMNFAPNPSMNTMED